MSKREEIAPDGHRAKSDVKPGQGDRGDHRAK
jgi:hypothetical protein